MDRRSLCVESMTFTLLIILLFLDYQHNTMAMTISYSEDHRCPVQLGASSIYFEDRLAKYVEGQKWDLYRKAYTPLYATLNIRWIFLLLLFQSSQPIPRIFEFLCPHISVLQEGKEFLVRGDGFGFPALLFVQFA